MGNIDIDNSRRKYHQECEYWIREETDRSIDLDTLAHKNKSNGVFYARAETPHTIVGGASAGVFMDDKHTVTIVTEDSIDEIGFNCIIRYKGKLWIVDSVQKKIIEGDNEFCNEEEYKYYITMRC